MEKFFRSACDCYRAHIWRTKAKVCQRWRRNRVTSWLELQYLVHQSSMFWKGALFKQVQRLWSLILLIPPAQLSENAPNGLIFLIPQMKTKTIYNSGKKIRISNKKTLFDFFDFSIAEFPFWICDNKSCQLQMFQNLPYKDLLGIKRNKVMKN